MVQNGTKTTEREAAPAVHPIVIWMRFIQSLRDSLIGYKS